MPIRVESAALFTHAFFVLQGTAFTQPAPGSASAADKPGAADAAWAAGHLGDMEEFTITPESEVFEKKAGRPGTVVTTDVIELSRGLKLGWTSVDITPLVPQLMFGTLDLTGASSQGNPLEGPLNVKGWLKFQAYTGASRRITGDLWVSLKVTNPEPWSGKNVVRAKFEATTVHSALNTLAFD